MGFKYIDQPIEEIKTGDRVQFAPDAAAETVVKRSTRYGAVRLASEFGSVLTLLPGATVRMIWSKPKDIQPLFNFRPSSAALMAAIEDYALRTGITKPNNGRGEPVANMSAAASALILRGLQDAEAHGTIDLPAELRN